MGKEREQRTGEATHRCGFCGLEKNENAPPGSTLSPCTVGAIHAWDRLRPEDAPRGSDHGILCPAGRSDTPDEDRPSDAPPRDAGPEDGSIAIRGRAGVVTVGDVAQDGTGPWKLFLGEYGVAQFPSKAAEERPEEYARSVADAIRKALADEKHGPICRSETPQATGGLVAHDWRDPGYLPEDRPSDAPSNEATDRQDEPRPGGGSRYTYPAKTSAVETPGAGGRDTARSGVDSSRGKEEGAAAVAPPAISRTSEDPPVCGHRGDGVRCLMKPGHGATGAPHFIIYADEPISETPQDRHIETTYASVTHEEAEATAQAAGGGVASATGEECEGAGGAPGKDSAAHVGAASADPGLSPRTSDAPTEVGDDDHPPQCSCKTVFAEVGCPKHGPLLAERAGFNDGCLAGIQQALAVLHESLTNPKGTYSAGGLAERLGCKVGELRGYGLQDIANALYEARHGDDPVSSEATDPCREATAGVTCNRGTKGCSVAHWNEATIHRCDRTETATGEATRTAPIPMVLHCPKCRTRHIDEGEFATKVHHTHSCQGCGLTWRPCVLPTVGVQFLPGFKNEPVRPTARHPSLAKDTADALAAASDIIGRMATEIESLKAHIRELEGER